MIQGEDHTPLMMDNLFLLVDYIICRFIMWSEEWQLISVGSFPFMEAYILRVDAIGSVLGHSDLVVRSDFHDFNGYTGVYHNCFRVFKCLLVAKDQLYNSYLESDGGLVLTENCVPLAAGRLFGV